MLAPVKTTGFVAIATAVGRAAAAADLTTGAATGISFGADATIFSILDILFISSFHACLFMIEILTSYLR